MVRCHTGGLIGFLPHVGDISFSPSVGNPHRLSGIQRFLFRSVTKHERLVHSSFLKCEFSSCKLSQSLVVLVECSLEFLDNKVRLFCLSSNSFGTQLADSVFQTTWRHDTTDCQLPKHEINTVIH